jgi:hypothetical protein
MTAPIRKLLMLAATVYALAVPAWLALSGWGLTAKEFSNPGDETLRAADYAFSIWGLIYAGLAIQAVFHLVARRNESLLRALSPAIVAIAGCGAWLVASGADARWLTVVIIVVSAASAWWALHRAKGRAQGRWASGLAVWPIAMLGGWLLIASVINILTVATAEGLIGPGIAEPMALTAIVAAAFLAAAVVTGGVCALYGLPVVWGLVAVFVAEREDASAVAYAAAAAAAVVAGASVIAAIRQRRARPG